jgi:hypothetical protein
MTDLLPDPSILLATGDSMNENETFVPGDCVEARFEVAIPKVMTLRLFTLEPRLGSLPFCVALG